MDVEIVGVLLPDALPLWSRRRSSAWYLVSHKLVSTVSAMLPHATAACMLSEVRSYLALQEAHVVLKCADDLVAAALAPADAAVVGACHDINRTCARTRGAIGRYLSPKCLDLGDVLAEVGGHGEGLLADGAAAVFGVLAGAAP